ncbi:MAG: DUF523 domain-containing protein [Myxococcota bacterium]
MGGRLDNPPLRSDPRAQPEADTGGKSSPPVPARHINESSEAPGQEAILVSACLLGESCRYDCQSCKNEAVLSWLEGKNTISVCPEQDGGLPTPRAPSEIVSGQGADVLHGDATVRSKDGADNTDAFVRGANAALEMAKRYGATVAIMKAKSPSCGAGTIYDGSFSGNLAVGDGVTTALLKINGIRVITEDEISNDESKT